MFEAIHEIECCGVQRDLGWSQGRALRESVRISVTRPVLGSRVARWLEPWFPQLGVKDRIAIDVKRHFPQQGDRASGLADAAGLSHGAILSAVGRLPTEFLASCAVLSRKGSDLGRPMLALALPTLPRGSQSWLLRRSRVEHGFSSIEWTLPAWVGSIVGVNEKGLVLCWQGSGRPYELNERSAAPALHWIQDCLQLFDQVEKVGDWCTKRPTSGDGFLLALDHTGAVLVVEQQGPQQKIHSIEADYFCIQEGRPATLDSAELSNQASISNWLKQVQPNTQLSWLDPATRSIYFLKPSSKLESIATWDRVSC